MQANGKWRSIIQAGQPHPETGEPATPQEVAELFRGILGKMPEAVMVILVPDKGPAWEQGWGFIGDEPVPSTSTEEA